MAEAMEKSLSEMIANWTRMQKSELDDAEEAADRFQTSFYVFIDRFRDWFEEMSDRSRTLEAVLKLPEVSSITQRLPDQLQLNFETELGLIVEGTRREEDNATSY